MTLHEIVAIEMNGLVSTINDYSMEHYIHNYTDKLKNYQLPKDQSDMLLVVNRLIQWYEQHIEDITNNKYIYNKHEHLKSYKLLIELQEKLQ